jgi:hypothetical protein
MIGLNPFPLRGWVFHEFPGPLLQLPFCGLLLRQRVQLERVFVGNQGQPFKQFPPVPCFALGFSFGPA